MNMNPNLEPVTEMDEHRPSHLYPVAAERACVGLVLQRGGKAMSTIRELVRVEDFDHAQSRAALQALVQLDDDGQVPVSGRLGLVALVTAIRANGDASLFPGGQEQVHRVFLHDAPAFGGAEAPENAARLVAGASQLRLSAEAATSAAREIRNRADLARSVLSREFLERVSTEFADLAARTVSDEPAVHVSVLVDEHDRLMQDRLAGNAATVETGIDDLDRLLDGSDADAGNLVIVAARPSMGKTAVMQAITRGQFIRPKTPESALSLTPRPWSDTWSPVADPVPVLLASAEMGETEIFDRQVSDLVTVNNRTIQRPVRPQTRAEDLRRWAQLEPMVRDAKAFARTWPLAYVPRPRLIEEIERTAKGWRRKHPVLGLDARGRERRGAAVLLVDHLTEIGMLGGRPKGMREDQYYGEIGRRLKELAKDLRIVVVLLMQLSRKVESRDDKRPMLSDLREAGKIEELADAALFCYRAPYYGTDEKSESQLWARYWDAIRARDYGKAQTMFGLATEMEIIARKVRQGSIGTARVSFLRNFTRVVDRGSVQAEFG